MHQTEARIPYFVPRCNLKGSHVTGVVYDAVVFRFDLHTNRKNPWQDGQPLNTALEDTFSRQCHFILLASIVESRQVQHISSKEIYA